MNDELLALDYSRCSFKNYLVFKFMMFFSKSQNYTGILNKYFCYRFHRIPYLYRIEISSKTNIGLGLYIGHPFNTTINEQTVIGINCNIHKGITTGEKNRGSRKEYPVIGNNVWVGVNFSIVRKITVGSNVLIVRNARLNYDILGNSNVAGNPCKIISPSTETGGYVNYRMSIKD